jgi:aminoglycoside/choline kinase family phosphotransferase
MTKRDTLASDFLSSTPWKNAQRHPLAGDASMRRYERLFDPKSDKTFIFMDAPPEKGEDVRPFLKVAAYLSANGLSTPNIYEGDIENGFLIMEDLGHDMYDVVCNASASLEPELYAAAVEALVAVAQAPLLEGAQDYQPQMLDHSLACVKWYAEPILGSDLSPEKQTLAEALSPLIASLGDRKITILRDFHAQNLLWLPNRTAPKNVGLLDFQDATLGHPAYDLISLTTDARRNVSPEIKALCFEKFAGHLDLNRSDFSRDAAICSVVRNLRILMVFARMSLHFSRPHYVDFIPRVWGYLMTDLAHPDLSELSMIVKVILPAPTPDRLKRLKLQCGTVPTL